MHNNTHENNTDVTLDDLARMIARGFKEADARFTEIDDSVAGIEVRMATKEDLEQLEDRLENRIDILESGILKDHGTRLRRVERKLQVA